MWFGKILDDTTEEKDIYERLLVARDHRNHIPPCELIDGQETFLLTPWMYPFHVQCFTSGL